MPKTQFDQTDAVILCGGFGTRLRSVVSDVPKGLARIGGRPFLDILVDHLKGYGLRRFVFCVGYLKEQVVEHFQSRGATEPDTEYAYSEENEPLGTGGALTNARKKFVNESLLVLNGDSFCDADLAAFAESHADREAELSIVLYRNEETGDYGTVDIDAEQRLTAFREKQYQSGGGLINAGIYLMPRALVDAMPPAPFSLEKDFFPNVIGGRRSYGFLTDAPVLDIGTPERYEQIDQIFRSKQQSS